MSSENYPIFDVIHTFNQGQETCHFVWIWEDEIYEIEVVRPINSDYHLKPTYPMNLPNGKYYVYFDGQSYVITLKNNKMIDYD